MKYPNIQEARFVSRLNRFAARVEINGELQDAHVKNTGRCRELLIPGVPVYLVRAPGPLRKTSWDLVSVLKNNRLMINMDSQAPNRVAAEWLATQGFDEVRSEFPFGKSRLDFFMRRGKTNYLMEVKGCTLEKDGIGYFPDAPTARGVRHIRELMRARESGYDATLLFVIQINGVHEVCPNGETHPEFARVWEEAEKAGVRIAFLECQVTPDSLVSTGSSLTF